MDEPPIDLRDRRGRLLRLAAATVIGAVLTVGIALVVGSSAGDTNTDPISRSSQFVTVVAVFLAATLGSHAVITRIARRRR